MSMQRDPELHEPLEGSEEYFSAKVPDLPESPRGGKDEAHLPPPQDMGEDG